MITTAISKMFGIKHPIIGAPMFLVSGPELVAAVSNAGGLGTMPSLNGRSHDDFVELLRQIEQQTQKPYGINLILKDNPRLEEDLQACLQHRVALLITSLGDPTHIIERAHSSGTKVFCDVTNKRHADKAAAAGADGLVAVCAGAGGHAGTLSPLVFIPWLVDTYDIPVAAAGGIADGRGLAASLTLGAAAAYIGTRLVASSEALAPPEYQRMIVQSLAEDVEYTPEVTGVPCNFLKPSLNALRQGEVKQNSRYKEIWTAGHNVALIDSVRSAREIVQDMARQAQALVA